MAEQKSSSIVSNHKISESSYKKAFVNGYKYLLDMGINESEIANVFGTKKITKGSDDEIEKAYEQAMKKIEGRLSIQMLVQSLGYDYEEERILYKPPPNFLVSEDNGIIKVPNPDDMDWIPCNKQTYKKHQPGNSTLFTLFMTNKFPKNWKVSSELINKREESYDAEPGKRNRKKIEAKLAEFLASDTKRT